MNTNQTSRLLVVALATFFWTANAHAQDEVQSETPVPAESSSNETRLDLFGGLSYLTNTESHGAGVNAGLRLGIGKHLALSFDAMWGAMASSHTAEDRWWLMPSIAFVVPADDVQLDFGAGFGFANSAGYSDFDAFSREPFNPDWAYQFAPAVRLHAVAWLPMEGTSSNPSTRAFVRFDASTLLLEGNNIGSRETNHNPRPTDSITLSLAAGFAFRAM